METIHLLRSPSGGTAARQAGAHALIGAYEERGHHVVDLTGPDAATSADSLHRAIEDAEVTRLVIAGGDGLVHLVIQLVAGTHIVVAPAPAGTGNDFAAALGIDEVDIDRTLAAPVAVDLMKVEHAEGESWAASVVIAGFPAAINARADRIALPLGSAVYSLAALLELPRFERRLVELTIDGTATTTDTAMLAVGNTRFFGGGMLVCPDARADDGLLHLTSIEGVGRVGLLRHLARKSGGSADRPEVRRQSSRQLSIDTPGLDLWADGEPLGRSPATITVEPGALRVAGASTEPSE